MTGRSPVAPTWDASLESVELKPATPTRLSYPPQLMPTPTERPAAGTASSSAVGK